MPEKYLSPPRAAALEFGEGIWQMMVLWLLKFPRTITTYEDWKIDVQSQPYRYDP